MCLKECSQTDCWKVLGAPKLEYGNKTKESIFSQKLGSRYFWQVANGFLNQDKSAIPPLFNGMEKKTFLETLILMTQVSLYLFSLPELI